MAEKYTCKACYKKFTAKQKSKCPQCGTSAQLQDDLSPAEIHDFLLAGADSGDQILTFEDLEYELDNAKRGVRLLGGSVVILIFSIIIGGAFFAYGSISRVSCVFQSSSCGADTSSIGLIIMVVGLLVSIALATSAITAARR